MTIGFNINYNIIVVQSVYSTILIHICKSNSALLCHTRIWIKFAQNKLSLLQFLSYIIMRDLSVLVYNVIVIPVSNDISLLLDQQQRPVTIRLRYIVCFFYRSHTTIFMLFVISPSVQCLKSMKYCFCKKKIFIFLPFLQQRYSSDF